MEGKKSRENIRKIIHIDMDCFYAAIEMREQPHLKNRALAVGGKPEERGVLTTCNYEARKYGLHSAMPSSQAFQLCPKLTLLPVNMALYKKESVLIHEIFKRYTSVIEPISLDEAYLEVTQSLLHGGSATLIAREIRQVILDERNLTASAGIAENKFLAKIASDWNKPAGQFTIPPENSADFAAELSVRKFPGVGKVGGERMEKMNIRQGKDLLRYSINELAHLFGRFGIHLYHYSRGIDTRPVKNQRIRKSVSTEDTFIRDISGEQECLRELKGVYVKFIERFNFFLKENKNIDPPWKCFVKIKFSDFSQTTIERSFSHFRYENFALLFKERYQNQNRKVRLLGLGVRLPQKESFPQLSISFE